MELFNDVDSHLASYCEGTRSSFSREIVRPSVRSNMSCGFSHSVQSVSLELGMGHFLPKSF